MLALEGATIGYGCTALLENAELTLNPGEVKGLVAPNGYGKTTLLRVMSGNLRRLRCGCVRLEGREMRTDFCSGHIMYVPGDASMLYGFLSVREHLRIVRDLWESGLSLRDAAEACGVAEFLGRHVGRLSQGMKQQVTLAMAYLSGARYVLLDEPMNALDPLNVQRFSKVIRRMAEHGAGVLVSSHILDNVNQLCTSAIFVRDRRLEEVPLDKGAESLFASYYGTFGGDGMSESGFRVSTTLGTGARPRGRHFKQ